MPSEPSLAATAPEAAAALPRGPLGLSAPAAGIALALLAPVLWSTSGVFLKLLPLEAVPLAGLRALIAGLVLAPFIRPGRIAWSGALAIVVAAYTVSVVSYVSAAKLTTIANAIGLFSTSPAWVMALTWIAARRVVWSQLAPVAIILGGIGIVLSEPATGGSLQGNLLALLAAFGFSLFTFFVSRVDRASPGLISLCNLAVAAVLFAVAPGAFRPAEIAPWEWAVLGFLGAVQIALATVCFGAALRRIPAMQASLLALLEPLLAPIWVFLALGEVPSAYTLAGGGCILGGILTDFWMRRLSIRPRPLAPGAPQRRPAA